MVEIIKVVDADSSKMIEVALKDANITVKHERLEVLKRYFRIKYGKEVLFTYKEIKEPRAK